MTRFLLGLLLALLILSGGACGRAAPAPPVEPPTQAAPTATQPPVAAEPAPERIEGIVRRFDGGVVTLDNGTSFSVPPESRVLRLIPTSLAELQPGQYVAVTARRQPDNTLLASIVNVFPEAMRGLAPGQRPMTGGNLMTNATIETVEGNAFTVTFPGGGAQVRLAPEAQVNKLESGSLADITVGASLSAFVADGTARSVTVR